MVEFFIRQLLNRYQHPSFNLCCAGISGGEFFILRIVIGLF